MTRSRLVHILLVVLFFTGLTGLLLPLPLARAASMLLGTFLVVLVAAHDEDRPFPWVHGLRRFLAKEGPIVVTRSKMVHLVSAILIACWVIFLVGNHMFVARESRISTLLCDPLSLCRPLPEATQETYQRVVLSPAPSSKASARDRSQDRTHLSLAFAEDIPELLARYQREGRPIREDQILWTLRICPRDLRPALLQALRDPNRTEALIVRTRLGDQAAKRALEEIFEADSKRLAEVATWSDSERRLRAEAESLRERIGGLSSGLGGPVGHDHSGQGLPSARGAAPTAEAPSEFATLVRIADALALINTPRDAEQYYSRLIKPLAPGGYGMIMVRAQDSGRLEPRGVEPRELLDLAYERPQGTDLAAGAAHEPNDLQGLLVRARSKDSSAKPALERAFNDRLARWSRVISEDSEEDRLLDSALRAAGALACASEPKEGQERFSRLMPRLVDRVQWERDRNVEQVMRRGSASLFTRSLDGVPRTCAQVLLKTFLLRVGISSVSEIPDVIPMLLSLADGELAQAVLDEVTARPVMETAYRDIPIGRAFHVSEMESRRYLKDKSHEFLEAIYPHLTKECMPRLLACLDSDNEQTRAFAVWSLTALGHPWSSEQLGRMHKDTFWKVRLNAIWAYEPGHAPPEGASLVAAVAATVGRGEP